MCEFFNFMIIPFWFRFDLLSLAMRRFGRRPFAAFSFSFWFSGSTDESKCESKYLCAALLPIFVYTKTPRRDPLQIGFRFAHIIRFASACGSFIYLLRRPKSQHSTMLPIAIDTRAATVCQFLLLWRKTTRKMNENTCIEGDDQTVFFPMGDDIFRWNRNIASSMAKDGPFYSATELLHCECSWTFCKLFCVIILLNVRFSCGRMWLLVQLHLLWLWASFAVNAI